MASKRTGNRQGRASAARSSGVTLIELMIAVVIIGILTAIAYPSYRNYTLKSNRAAAQSFMMSVASREEQLMLDNRAYLAAANNTAVANNLRLAVPAEVSRYYQISVALNASSPWYTITAAPIAGTAQAGDPNLTLDSNGTKAPASLWK